MVAQTILIYTISFFYSSDNNHGRPTLVTIITNDMLLQPQLMVNFGDQYLWHPTPTTTTNASLLQHALMTTSNGQTLTPPQTIISNDDLQHPTPRGYHLWCPSTIIFSDQFRPPNLTTNSTNHILNKIWVVKVLLKTKFKIISSWYLIVDLSSNLTLIEAIWAHSQTKQTCV